ncbi:excinuclease ABC subunit UvrA [Vagococcus sp. BWB3-3]|uniref:UvrABC system protein A n=1 Tax=Vagococcus allomyrinae TaxID=2794353 RepID=A0A940STM6_9ENTE|nr:excinuclease ABC subunit UvrA [Vagococcus allomyrinae]MBP1040455.1 excinuclease ABC subunit UvrA [Vagococcus allomyrinae]
MTQEYLILKGARENNLKNISLAIPKRQLTVFTGVSGSGKSSIVFDTIATESQRQMNETHSTFVRNFLPKYQEPDIDSIEHLSTSVVIDQKRIGGNSRSTLGTITDINGLIRLLFSRVGQPHIGNANYFSFNQQLGMCPECDGIGRKITVDISKMVDRERSLNEGAILFPIFANNSWYLQVYLQSGFFDNDKKLKDYSEAEWQQLLNGNGVKVKVDNHNINFEGLLVKFDRMYLKKEGEVSERTQKQIAQFTHETCCELCLGQRVSQAALSSKIKGYNIADFLSMELPILLERLVEIDQPDVHPLIKSLRERLQNLIDIGLDYLNLARETSTLSGGESQRVKMVRHLNSSLTDLLYIFDEPSIGLHPRDVARMNQLLIKLRDKGNTVLVIEHDPDVIKIADHVIEVGPHAGVHGGEIMFEGSFAELLTSTTLTGRFLQQKLPFKTAPRQAKGQLTAPPASIHNLKNVSVSIPEGVLTVVTGVAGSGKSSLIYHSFLKEHPAAVVIDQAATHTSSRSTPVTYMGILDELRKQFGKENGVSPSLFSFNSKGACEECKGLGYQSQDLAFMDSIRIKCATCHGKRFKESVLRYHLNGQTISDILEMTVEQAVDFFQATKIHKKVRALQEVGLGYITLGQPLNTLSGGEAQRLKLASELHKKSSLYIMDEPSTGLHLSDIAHILEIINKLVDKGSTVVVIEHHVDIIRQADWAIDIGPDGGSRGGQIVFAGTPKEMSQAPESITGRYL